MDETILIVNHNKEERLIYESWFNAYGFHTFGIHSSNGALKLLNSMTPDAIFIDMEIPGINGLELCKEIRTSHSNLVPINITSSTYNEMESVLGFELGADEYIVKPLREKEMVARVRAFIRTRRLCCSTEQEQSTSIKPPRKNSLKNGDLYLDHDHFVFYVKDTPIELTRKEYELLYLLIKNKGKVLTRKKLATAFMIGEGLIDERVIDVFISRIRNKIEPSRRNPYYIKTVRNMGYVMVDIPPRQLDNCEKQEWSKTQP